MESLFGLGVALLLLFGQLACDCNDCRDSRLGEIQGSSLENATTTTVTSTTSTTSTTVTLPTEFMCASLCDDYLDREVICHDWPDGKTPHQKCFDSCFSNWGDLEWCTRYCEPRPNNEKDCSTIIYVESVGVNSPYNDCMYDCLNDVETVTTITVTTTTTSTTEPCMYGFYRIHGVGECVKKVRGNTTYSGRGDHPNASCSLGI